MYGQWLRVSERLDGHIELAVRAEIAASMLEIRPLEKGRIG